MMYYPFFAVLVWVIDCIQLYRNVNRADDSPGNS